MTHAALPAGLAGLLGLLAAACTPPGVRPDAPADDLGAAREERPGDVYAQLGQEYMRERQPAVALRKLKRGLEIDPDNARVHAILGQLYQQLGEARLAGEHYARSTALEPRNPYFHNAWGGFLCDQGDYDQADEQFRLALGNPLYQQPWAAQTNAGVCALRAGRTEQAEQYLRQALAGNPTIALALLKLGQIRLDAGDYAGARTYLERHAQVAGPTPQGLALRLRAAQGLGDKAATKQLRAELAQRFPDAPETRAARELSPP